MFTTLIVQPIFNLLVLIYGILPGHNFGLSIIIFTILVRILMWPLVKKQLHQSKIMRELQPELKRIKKTAAGDRQKESVLMMELYKERGVNPFASFGLIFLQLPIFIALYNGLNRIVQDPKAIVDFSYSWVNSLSWLQAFAKDISLFDSTLFGFVDLSRSAIEKTGGIYWPAMVIVIASVVIQYYQAKQLMPNSKDKKSLKKILSEAGQGKTAETADINEAVSRSTLIMLPAFIFLVTINIASALSLYWLVSGAVAFLQQQRVLSADSNEMITSTTASIASKSKAGSKKQVIEAEIIPPKKTITNSKTKKNSKNKNKKGNNHKR
ncbi:membrane protein insertase YidC [Candidatus Saccharibacteria bacterium]|nr:membrane protein insertase YidC [Candidatus Saccharibacteria bacterium]